MIKYRGINYYDTADIAYLLPVNYLYSIMVHGETPRYVYEHIEWCAMKEILQQMLWSNDYRLVDIVINGYEDVLLVFVTIEARG